MTQYRKITENMAGKLKPKEAYLFYAEEKGKPHQNAGDAPDVQKLESS